MGRSLTVCLNVFALVTDILSCSFRINSRTNSPSAIRPKADGVSQFQNSLIPARRAKFLYARKPAVSILQMNLKYHYRFSMENEAVYLTDLSVSIAGKMLLKLGYEI